MKLLILILLLTTTAKAPIWSSLVVVVPEPIMPYEAIWRAVCQVESSGNPKAYNKKENAVGIAQIRPIRVKDYNRRTGKNYKLKDMYDKSVSKEVFMYYCLKYQSQDKIIRGWNGSGSATYKYLKKVKKNIL